MSKRGWRSKCCYKRRQASSLCHDRGNSWGLGGASFHEYTVSSPVQFNRPSHALNINSLKTGDGDIGVCWNSRLQSLKYDFIGIIFGIIFASLTSYGIPLAWSKTWFRTLSITNAGGVQMTCWYPHQASLLRFTDAPLKPQSGESCKSRELWSAISTPDLELKADHIFWNLTLCRLYMPCGVDQDIVLMMSFYSISFFATAICISCLVWGYLFVNWKRRRGQTYLRERLWGIEGREPRISCLGRFRFNSS